MAKIKVPHLVTRSRAGGRKAYYWQPSATLQAVGMVMKRLSDDPHVAVGQAQAENERAAAALTAARAAPADQAGQQGTRGRIDPDSVEAMIRGYLKSDRFKRLRPKTQAEYKYNLGFLSRWAGDRPKRAITPALAEEFYKTMAVRMVRGAKGKMVAKPRPALAAAICRTACLVFYWDRVGDRKVRSAVEVAQNPFAMLGIDRDIVDERDPELLLWTEDAVAAYVAKADELGLHALGTAITINYWFGQRVADLIRIPRTLLSGGQIKIKQSKRGRWVVLPTDIVPKLVARIEAELARRQDREAAAAARAAKKGLPAPAIETPLLVPESRGRVFTTEQLANQFERVRDKIRADEQTKEWGHLTLQRLRHSAITRLAEAGCTDAEIAAISGHSQETIKLVIDRYSARTGDIARNAITKRLAAEAGPAKGE